jgi:pimeloyl-ACP methyl ester carboxylesterase
MRMALENLPARFRKYENHASRYVVVDGMRVHYRDEGQGPTLVLLHGVMASLHTWDGWVDALRPHYRIVRIDLPGFGFSDDLRSDEDYTPEASVKRMNALLRALGVDRFHLAGNSLGGFLSWYYAASHPERVDRMILISPIAYPQKLPFVIEWFSKPGLGHLAQYVAPRFIVEQNVRMVYGDPTGMSPGTADRYYDLLQYGRNRIAMVKMFRVLRGYNESTTIAQRVRDVKTPTLLMWGAKDRWVPPALIDLWKRDIPGAAVQVYPDLGHVAMEELPDVTARDAHRFLTPS